VTGSEDIEQAIHIILDTSPGERVMRPLFGCQAKEMVFESIRPETMTLMADAVQQALTMWEPRILVHNVHVERDPKVETALVCIIEYEINTTHDNRNIVHPFYIDKEPELD
jgi:phage baseplate assembly protein W